ncbi:MAG: hypothetical protein CVV27_10555 [Candidatus Melainabacteria bacterium HGW-Melainabacteria-1]|nr:MAG: hypothetical protein CVV27_10555 [Candidatus Melainabacteria bacterium HGW-Melainabacteria-1]
MAKPRALPTIKIERPRLPIHLEALTLSPEDLLDDNLIRQSLLQDQVLDSLDSKSLGLIQTRLQQLSLRYAHLPKLEAIDGIWQSLDLSNSELGKASLSRLEASQCKALGLLAQEASFTDVVFRDCNFSLAQFGRARFKQVHFENCLIQEADFQASRFNQVSFRNCDLSGCDFSEAVHSHLDLRGSLLEGIRFRPQDISGLILEAAQAPALMPLLGVRLAELAD